MRRPLGLPVGSVTGLSLNEAAALARKAARGAGHDWGMAEEAGRAVRWLSARGLPALDALAAMLAAPACAPRLREGTLDADGPLCPIRAGAAVSDLACLPGFAGLRLRQVRTPLLALPFAAAAARATGRAVRLTGAGGATTDGHALALHGDWLATTDLTLTLCDITLVPVPPIHRAQVAPSALAALDALAARTCAPATETSRRLGAGP
ncbi:DUF3726 domain-containing protein [Jannaschia formosa]|uniref:DUF3726 domain-containing protein n=1 Tax=Jannaschia formosa TaxID=2259592 RepID=UPI00143074AA|nr:DUF3726 domain-containing protein [Jannaschia formosa]